MRNPHKYPAACSVYAITLVLVDYVHNSLTIQVTPLTWSQMALGHNADSSDLVFLPKGVKMTDQIEERLDSILKTHHMGFKGMAYVQSTCHKKDLALMVFRNDPLHFTKTTQVHPLPKPTDNFIDFGLSLFWA